MHMDLYIFDVDGFIYIWCWTCRRETNRSVENGKELMLNANLNHRDKNLIQCIICTRCTEYWENENEINQMWKSA